MTEWNVDGPAQGAMQKITAALRQNLHNMKAYVANHRFQNAEHELG